jgi:hypothetical protein
MNEFFDSIKVDLLDSRRRPLLIAVVVLLVGAIAYAALAGGSSSGGSSSSPGPEPSLPVSGIHPTQAQPSTNEAVAETTSGASQQHAGGTRDPFTLLPGANKPSTTSTSTTTTTATSTGNSASGTSTGGTGSGGGTKPATHTKKHTVYTVAVLFGKAKPGTPAQEAGLTPFEHLKQNQLIPDAKQPLVAFRGVLVGGESAAFTLVGEEAPILRGLGTCKPSATECRTLDLKVGQTEELEYLPLSGGEAVTYELQVASIVFLTTVKTSPSAARVGTDVRSKRGSELLHKLGLIDVPGLRYSERGGVFVFAPAVAPAHAARAHTAAQRRR